MKILLASKNKNKIAEIKTLLSECVSDINVLSLDDINYNDEIEENGKTFEENAKIKAEEIYKIAKIPTVSDDSGLEVDFLYLTIANEQSSSFVLAYMELHVVGLVVLV